MSMKFEKDRMEVDSARRRRYARALVMAWTFVICVSLGWNLWLDQDLVGLALVHGLFFALGFAVIRFGQQRIESREIERVGAEKEVRNAHAELQMLLRSIPSILIGVDSRDIITEWNPVAVETFGIPRDAVVGRPFMESGIHWDWASVLKQIADRMHDEDSIRMDDVSFTRPDGKEGILGITINPITDHGDNLNGYLLLGAEVTERKVLEAQLAQAQKLESIGQLAAGIAHEINTPTQYVGDNTRFLKEAFEDLMQLLSQMDELLVAVDQGKITPELAARLRKAADTADLTYLTEEIPRAIDQSLEGVGRVAKIVGAMKEFSHPGAADFTTIDINRAIESTTTVARNEWKYVSDLELDLDDDLPLIPCLPGEFNQVILNIIINASHAIADVVGDGANGKGKITVKTRLDGDMAEIRIADTGTGIPEECRSKIFDQFFTTKEVGKGTGQGLAIAHSVITQKHGGSITFESEVGKGTEFIIRLPVKERAATGGDRR